ncbi:MAG: selenocysteine-specific translation elongation factor [Proteobacteria bacterium]|nr:selenocysteine-specific translation elongation factor [Pseudomonadota bacterium]
MSQIILGTAGHIDHGKTALIKALTGVDLDRLKEEKERGITIELGFASLSLSSDQRIGIVDVPGHERFVKRMVAGAGGIDIVMLIVAADDGVMPQTREHFAVCQLLGIKHGLIVITKKDLVEPEWLDLVKDDIKQLIKGTFLDGAPIIPVSSITREGITHVVSAIEQIVPNVGEKASDGIPFLPVDRIFTMKGFGTVATGTLISGTIRLGETLEVLPAGLQAKVRGLQVHNSAVEASLAGQRTAINLKGFEKGFIKRGDVLSLPDLLEPAHRFDVRLELLPDAPAPLKHGEEVRLHLFTSQTLARIISYENNVLEPGGSYFVQLRFAEPLVSIPGARFVIRNIDASRTIGGGIILSPHPPKHRRKDPNTRIWFQMLEDKKLEDILATLARNAGINGITRKDLLRQVNAPAGEIEKTWKDLKKKKMVVEINPDSHQAIHCETLIAYENRLETILKEYHRQNPLKTGMLLEEAKNRLGIKQSNKFYDCLIQAMEKKGSIKTRDDAIHHAGHQISLTPGQTKLKTDIESALSSMGLTPPTLRELTDQFSVSPSEIKTILKLSVQERSVVRVKEELWFAREHIALLAQKVIEYLKENKELTPGDFKKITGISRKYSIPLLEYFDREKITVRVGDKRLLRESKSLG